MIIKGNFNITQSWPKLIAVFTTIPITIILGRFFCGWFCAFGAFNDFIYIISKKVFKIKFTINERLDYILKYFKYVILIFILCVIWTNGSDAFDNLSPWNAFAQITQFPQAVLQYPIGFIILALIVIGAFFIERFFCRYLCPLGAVFSMVSKIRIFKINKPTAQCGKCRLCTNNCSMGINLYKMDKVTSGECINCLKCTEVCPRKNAQASICNENINPTFASAVAIAAFTGVYCANSMIGSIIDKNNLTTGYNNSSISSNVAAGNNSQSGTLQGNYKDGTYTGVGFGYRPNLKVSVTIKSNKITNIQIVSHNESRGYYEEPFNVVPKEIIESQSTNVDAVSGATRSSNGIMSAVKDALSQAKISGESTDSSVSESNNDTSMENNNQSIDDQHSREFNDSMEDSRPYNKTTDLSMENNSSSTENSSNTTVSTNYKDGTYTGVGRGFKPGLTVSVTVKDGKIANIEIVSHRESRGYYEESFNVVPKEIIESQSTEVDSVSGATRSSRGIMDAVSNALNQAKM
jgi:Polyferredoxin